jgi:tRNA pseudouridine13 synthase
MRALNSNVPRYSLDFAHVGSRPGTRGEIRCAPEDFQVEEQLGFEPTGEGEHVLLQVRKRNANTEWVARQLARHAGVRPVDVGYAGLKDRIGVTTQWFSVHLRKQADPNWDGLQTEEIQILACARHNRKLRRGSLQGNRFEIVVRQIVGDRDELVDRLTRIAEAGIPNYFGEQRFGHNGQNLIQADALFQGRGRQFSRHKRGLYLSAARSFLFNRVLSARVERACWDRAIAGDVMMLEGSQSVFPIEEVTQDICARVDAMDIHPTGPLWGRGRLPTGLECGRLEEQALAEFDAWRVALEHVGLGQERRALRVKVGELDWEWLGDDSLRIRFFLPRGSYATSVLRQLILRGQ